MLSKLTTLRFLKRKRPLADGDQPAAAVETPKATRPCRSCGAPLSPDQACCVECGTVVRRRRIVPQGWPLRAGIASALALIVSACAGLGASAAVQGGGQMPKTVAVAPPPTAPPSTGPAVPAPPATPAPGAAAPAPAAPAAPAHPAAPASPAKPAGTTPSTGGGTGSGGGGSGGGGGGGTPSTAQAQPSGGSFGPFPNGISPNAVYLFPQNDQQDHPDELQNINDADGKTKWVSGPNAGSRQLGVVLDAGTTGRYSQLGILPGTASGYSVEIYGSDANSPPATPPTQGGGWLPLSGSELVGGRTKINLSYQSYPASFQPRYFIIWFTAVPGSSAVSIAEAAFLGG